MDAVWIVQARTDSMRLLNELLFITERLSGEEITRQDWPDGVYGTMVEIHLAFPSLLKAECALRLHHNFRLNEPDDQRMVQEGSFLTTYTEPTFLPGARL